MTHTIHRKSYDGDYIIVVSATGGINSQGSGDKARELLRRLAPLAPLSYGNPKDGSTLQMSRLEVANNLKDGSRLHIVFNSEAKTREAIKIIKELDLGLSICLSGPQETADKIIADFGLQVDSGHVGLGSCGCCQIEGGVEGIVSLCGHMRVSHHLVTSLGQQVKAGTMDVHKAAQKIASVCKCGLFNTELAVKLLEEI